MADALARDALLGVSLNYQLPMASLITVKLILIALFDANKSKTDGNSTRHVGSRMNAASAGKAIRAIWTPICWAQHIYLAIFVYPSVPSTVRCPLSTVHWPLPTCPGVNVKHETKHFVRLACKIV